MLLSKVLEFSLQIRKACDDGVKREELFLPSIENTIGDGATIFDPKSELYNVLKPFHGYAATEDAMKIMQKHRAVDVDLDIVTLLK